jgi:hypothetical protein
MFKTIVNYEVTVMTIKNQSKINKEEVLKDRAAIEHRATWFYLLLDEARKDGLDWNSFARRAITRCGCFHGNILFGDIENLKDFSKALISDTVKNIFEAEIVEVTDDKFILEFNYCPLVAAWLKQGASEEDIAELCDIAMDGDRGIVSTLGDYKLDLESTIAEGGDCCRIVIEKKK